VIPGVTGSPISDYGYTTPYGAATPRVRTSVGGLGVAAIALLALDAALSLLAAGFLIWRHSLLGELRDNPVTVDPNRLHDSDAAARDTMGWFTIVTVATIVVFICWFWAARNNAEAYSPNRGTLGVGWSVGGWFVPVAGLVLPCIVARDVYRGTMAGRRGRDLGGGQITGWWWAVYVAFWLMGFVVSGENKAAKDAVDSSRDDYLRHVQSAVSAGIVALAVGIAAAVLAIAYVYTVTKMQNARNGQGAWYGGPGAMMPAGPYGMAGDPMPPQAGPVPDRTPVADTRVAETQTADAQGAEPPEESGDRLTPPS
jgi:hypothetical protein